MNKPFYVANGKGPFLAVIPEAVGPGQSGIPVNERNSSKKINGALCQRFLVLGFIPFKPTASSPSYAPNI